LPFRLLTSHTAASESSGSNVVIGELVPSPVDGLRLGAFLKSRQRARFRSGYSGRVVEPREGAVAASGTVSRRNTARTTEQRTTGGWTIHAKSSAESSIDATRKIVYRDNFQAAFLGFVDWYKEALQMDELLQKGFYAKI
jgi:hypothetical protein